MELTTATGTIKSAETASQELGGALTGSIESPESGVESESEGLMLAWLEDQFDSVVWNLHDPSMKYP